MKKILVLTVMFFMTSFFSEKEAGNVSVNFGVFYSSLNPYGEWIQIDNNVVWRPYDVEYDWSPYSVGHWEYTPDGWYWDSYEPFGWATYHYGRWYYDNYYGWVWVPGYTWAPAWVEWRYNNNYIGWSPLPPFADFSISAGIHFSINVRTSYYHWHFVTMNHFHDRNVHHYFVPGNQKNHVFNNTKYRTNYNYRDGRVVNGGVSRNYIESRSGSRIREKSISRTNEMKDYTNSRTRTGDNVVAYQPAEREIEKYGNVETTNVKKSTSNKTSLTRDKVSFRDNTDASKSSSSRTTTTDRSAVRKSGTGSNVTPGRGSSADTRIKSDTRSSVQSRSSNSNTTSGRSSYEYNKNNNSSSRSQSTQSSRSYGSSSSNSNSSSSLSKSSSNNSGRTVSKSRSSSSSQVKESTGSSSSNKTTAKKSSTNKSQSNSSGSRTTSRSR